MDRDAGVEICERQQFLMTMIRMEKRDLETEIVMIKKNSPVTCICSKCGLH